MQPRRAWDINRVFDGIIEPCGCCCDSFRFELETQALVDDTTSFEQASTVIAWRYSLSHLNEFFTAKAGLRLSH